MWHEEEEATGGGRGGKAEVREGEDEKLGGGG